MNREKFLTEFLGALGAESITFVTVDHEAIFGTVHYAPSENCVFEEEEEDLVQDFRWHMKESDLPSESVFNLARLIHRKQLLDIDKLILAPDKLREEYNKEYQSNLNQADFDKVLCELEQVEVNMVDDGEETDIFFIHE